MRAVVAGFDAPETVIAVGFDAPPAIRIVKPMKTVTASVDALRHAARAVVAKARHRAKRVVPGDEAMVVIQITRDRKRRLAAHPAAYLDAVPAVVVDELGDDAPALRRFGKCLQLAARVVEHLDIELSGLVAHEAP